MKQLPPLKQRGDDLKASEFNLTTEAIRASKITAGRGMVISEGPGGRVIGHKKDWFWGRIIGNDAFSIYNNSGDATDATIDSLYGFWTRLIVTGGVNDDSKVFDTFEGSLLSRMGLLLDAITEYGHGWIVSLVGASDSPAWKLYPNFGEAQSVLGIGNIWTAPMYFSGGEYQFKQQYINNSSGDNTTLTTFAEKTNGLSGVATKYSDAGNGIKSVWVPEAYAQFYKVKDIKTIPNTRYVFDIKTQPLTNVLAVGTDTATKQVRFFEVTGKQRWAYDALVRCSSIVMDSNENVYAGLDRTTPTQTDAVLKIDSTGTKVWGWNPGADQDANALALNSSGKILVALSESTGNDDLVCLNTNGTKSWGVEIGSTLRGLAVDSNDNVYAGGIRVGGKTVWKYTSGGGFSTDADFTQATSHIYIDGNDSLFITLFTNPIKKTDTAFNVTWTQSVDFLFDTVVTNSNGDIFSASGTKLDSAGDEIDDLYFIGEKSGGHPFIDKDNNEDFIIGTVAGIQKWDSDLNILWANDSVSFGNVYAIAARSTYTVP